MNLLGMVTMRAAHQGAARRPAPMESTLWAGGLGLLFLLVYGGTNAWNATLDQVPSFHWAWEREIPLLPWSVVPYWSLDLFFLGSFFLVADRDQLRRHGARLAAAILGAAALFLVFPLRFDWGRPEVDGLPGLLFAALSLDQPFNQFPSLHVVLALLIWPLVRRRTSGMVRAGLGIWFLLIGLSTLTTWQHHFIDLVGGLAFGLLVGHVLPLDTEPLDRITTRHRALALRYGLGALTAGAIAMILGGMGLLLLWPAISLILVASAYVSGRRGFLKATAQGLPISTWLLFGPWLLGMRLNAALCRRQAGRPVRVAPGLWFGPHPRLTDLPDEVREHTRSHIISLAPEIPLPGKLTPGHIESSVEGKSLVRSEACVTHRTRLIPALDLLPPDAATLTEGLEAIRCGLAKGPVYVHCVLGLGRSAHLILAWLREQGLDEDQARARLLKLRPRAVLYRQPVRSAEPV